MEDLLEREEMVLPSTTYHVHNGRILGRIDGIDAIAQAVDKILRTELFAYVIYGPNYGIELERLIGEEMDFVKADLERTISEALLADDRIESISDFEMFQSKKNTLMCEFKVQTLEGSYTQTWEVNPDDTTN